LLLLRASQYHRFLSDFGMRVLFVRPGPVPPPSDAQRDEFYHYPSELCGDILQHTWAKQPGDLSLPLTSGRYPKYTVGNFTYHLFLGGAGVSNVIAVKLKDLWFYVREGLRLSRKQKYDCVAVYGWTLTGFAALIVARLTRSKLVVSVPNIPENAYRFNPFGDTFGNPKGRLVARVARRFSDMMLHIVLRRADCVRLYYPDQLKAYPKLANVPTFVTHNFVTMSQIPVTGVSDGSVLLVGAPWYVKGVDILIKAFRTIEADFPGARLRVLGHYPGQDFKDLIGDSRQIEVLSARGHIETMKIMANCSILVLASRTEALGKVLLEAGAAGKPVIAPKVGGVPYYIQDGVNGLLFERENVADLAQQLCRLLSSPQLQAELGKNGMEIARSRYNEAEFGRKFLEAVELAVKGKQREPALTAADLR